MKKLYLIPMTLLSAVGFAQQNISFEANEGFQLGTLHQQNGWEVTEGSDGVIQNQVITNEKASHGTQSFKNAYEPSFSAQWFPIFGASYSFDTPIASEGLIFSYDALADETLGADFELVLFAINADDEFTPVAGIGIENRGMFYFTSDENYGFEYAQATWQPNTWNNFKIEITATSINYYINGVLDTTINKFSDLNIVGFNMLHNNYGGNAYFDNFNITTSDLSTGDFSKDIVSIYPNPVSGQLHVVTPDLSEVNVEILTLDGKKVLATQSTKSIDLSAISAGIYLVKTTDTKGRTSTRKIVKN